MAVKASATITLTQYRDTQSVTRYYKLQPAGSSTPLKPETKPPSSDWTDSEPACDISKELYFCDLTIFSNGEGEYSTVSKSTSYEAAKQAFNKAQAAKDSIDNLEIGGRNLFIDSQKMAGYLGSGQTYGNLSAQNSVNKEWTSQDISCSEGDSFVLQVWRTVPESITSQPYWRAYQCYANDNSLVGGRPAWDSSATIDSNGIAYSVNIITIPKGASKFRFSARLYSDGFVKIEKGNKATDWTPAPEDVDAGIANVQTGVDSITETVLGEQTFNYILNGVTIPAYKREDGTYYYILNDEEVTVAESALVHDAQGDLTSYQEGGIYEDLEIITGDIEAIDTKVNGFDARETAIYDSIKENSLIARNYARFNNQSLIITNESETKSVQDLKSYLQLKSDSINIYSNKVPAVAIGVINNSGYMEMKGTSLFIAQESRLSTVRLRSAEKIGKLALVAGSDGHVSLKEVLD